MGIVTDKLVLAVLGNGTVLDVGPRALVGGDMLGNGLVCLHALVSEEIYRNQDLGLYSRKESRR